MARFEYILNYKDTYMKTTVYYRRQTYIVTLLLAVSCILMLVTT
jgi:hypothetical protein